MKRYLSALCAFVLLLGLAACQSTDNGAKIVGDPTSPVIFQVGSERYTVSDYQRRLNDDIGVGVANLLSQGQTREQIEQLAKDTDIRKQVLDRMIRDSLLMQYARRNSIGVDPVALDASVLAQMSAPVPGEPFVSFTGQRLDAAVSQVVFEVIARNTRIDMFHARHIMVQDEATADQIIAELQGGADFATLAAERSQDPGSASQGGDLGWQPKGAFVPEFEAAGFSAELNKPVKVQSQYGWHVIEVLERELQRAFTTDQLQSLLGRLQASDQQTGQSTAQAFLDANFTPWYDKYRAEAEAGGDLQISPSFDVNSIPLPFP